MSCAWRMLKSLGYKPWQTPERKKRIKIARRFYEHSDITLETIARKLKVSRSTISAWARDQKWKRWTRVRSVRTRYRKAAEDKLGRRLRPYEHVHHVDGDIENNEDHNLYVYSDAAAHSNGHWSLEQCAFKLVKRGLIRFVQGAYVLTTE